MSYSWNQWLVVAVSDGVTASWQLTDAGGFAIPMPSGAQIWASGVQQSVTASPTGMITFSSPLPAGTAITMLTGPNYQDRLWIPHQNTRSIKPRLWTAQFGDGYQQNAPQGLNWQAEKWQLQFTFGLRSDADALWSYLNAQGGYSAFWWRSPRGPNPMRVLCKEYSDITKARSAYTVNATFEQVFGL